MGERYREEGWNENTICFKMKERRGSCGVEQCIAPRPDTGRVVRRAGDLWTASRLFNPDSLSRLVLALAQRAVCSSPPT